MKMEFVVYSVSNQNQVVKVTSSPSTSKAGDWTAGLYWAGFAIRDKLTQIWVSK